ncbi:metalloregulator ArsR/SmtB family transcription factor [Kitasatospora purpeofusca]|uniref:metalloregulator ArsR/SmtB family transcription factor n=1 Tax=Kitasatospora purpeofusca TaxID=67352 RepID=UPI0030F3175B
MTEAQDEAGAFRALADPTRRQILEDLRGGEMAAGEIAAGFAMSAPSVSRHLGVLKGAGLVTERREGNRILYTLAEDRLAACIGRFLSAVCPEQIVLRRTTWRRGAQNEGS